MTAELDGLEALADVGAFLTEQIVPAVPAELASEVRAAVKLLETAAIELNQRRVLVLDEVADSLHYCRRTARLLPDLRSSQTWLDACERLARRAEQPGLDLRGLHGVAREIRALSSTALVELARHQRNPATSESVTAEAGELAADFCACLGDHARRRLAWQAVFPVPPDNPHPTGVTHE